MNKGRVNKQVLYSVIILLISVVIVLILWEHTFWLSLGLVVLEIIKFRVVPIKKEFPWYLSVSLISAWAEIVFVNVSGAWMYVQESLLNVPIYMPFLWGLLATTLIVIYQELFDQS